MRHRIYEAEHLGRTGFTLLLLRPEQHIQEEKEDPDGDPDVGHVEGRPVIAVPVDVQEVHHVPEPGAVDEVPQRPPQDEAKAAGRGPPVRVEVEVGEHSPDGEQGGYDEQGVPPHRVEVGQKPERDARVPDVDDVEEVDENRPRIVEVEAGHDPGLGALVRNHEPGGGQGGEGEFAKDRQGVFQERIAAAQRPHSAGEEGTVPTSAV